MLRAGEDFTEDTMIRYAERDLTPANDFDKLVRLEANGTIHPYFLGNNLGGNGEDGVLNVTSGTTTLDLSVQTVYNYESVTIAVGATLTFSNGTAGDKVPHIKVKGNFTNNGTITTKGLGPAGGPGGAACTPVNCTATPGTIGTAQQWQFVDTSLADEGQFGTGGTSQDASPSGGAGGIGGAAALANSTYFYPYAINGCGGGGGGGGASANVGTPGAGGAGGAGSLGLALEVLGNFSNTGTIELDGVNGTQGGNAAGNGSNSWASGGGGGGGGGGAGSLIVYFGGTYSNSGTITANGGTKGNGGPKTNTGGGGGSPRYGAGGGGGSGGANAFNDTLAGSNGALSSSPTGGNGSDGANGIIFFKKMNN